MNVVTGDLSDSVEKIAALLKGTDIVVSTIFPPNAADQIPLVDAAVQAGVKRILPCNWGTPAARGGIMGLRDLKETVHDHIFRQRLGFTIIDVGFWYQTSFPRVPSGKFDYAAFVPSDEVCAGGTAPNMLIDKKDVGRITVKIMKDKRTLNKRVIAYAEILNQNEINAIIEKKTGEKLDLPHVCLPVSRAGLQDLIKRQRSAEDIKKALAVARKAVEDDPSNIPNQYKMVWQEYCITKYVREDNTPENAEYLGYIDGRALYPDYEYIKFHEFVDELVAGKVDKPYPHLKL